VSTKGDSETKLTPSVPSKWGRAEKKRWNATPFLKERVGSMKQRLRKKRVARGLRKFYGCQYFGSDLIVGILRGCLRDGVWGKMWGKAKKTW